MSKLRQRVSVLAWDYAAGTQLRTHQHEEDQLVYAQRGVMTLTTTTGTWVVPPQRALWVPRGVDHSIVMSGKVEMRTLYLRGRALLTSCQVLEVSPFLRELVLDIVRRGGLWVQRGVDRARFIVLAAELRVTERPGMHLPVLHDTRAMRVMQALRLTPSANLDLRGSGLSLRTLQRIVTAETGISLGRYVRQLRLLRALELLASGQKVTAVALDCGYDSPSAFIAAFKSCFGATPAQYFRSA
ncbi:MAG: AraC family transcriptional regulator [Myxococcota bacterium]